MINKKHDCYFEAIRASKKREAKNRRGRKAYALMSPAQKLLKGAKERARKKELEIDIIAADIVVPAHCPILGIKLKSGTGTGGSLDSSPTLDRIDNSQGYIKGNIQVISRRANMIKNCATLEELKLIVKSLEND